MDDYRSGLVITVKIISAVAGFAVAGVIAFWLIFLMSYAICMSIAWFMGDENYMHLMWFGILVIMIGAPAAAVTGAIVAWRLAGRLF